MYRNTVIARVSVVCLIVGLLAACSTQGPTVGNLLVPVTSPGVQDIGIHDQRLLGTVVGKPEIVRAAFPLTTEVAAFRLQLAGKDVDVVRDHAEPVCLMELPDRITPEALKGTPKRVCGDLVLWKGHERGRPAGPDNAIIAVAKGSQLSASIANADKVFDIRPLQEGGSALYQVDRTKGESEAFRNDTVVPGETSRIRQGLDGAAPLSAAKRPNAVVVTLMVGFTQNGWNAQGGTDAAQMSAVRWVAEANAALSYSGANVQYLLLNVFNTGAPENGSLNEDLGDVQAGRGEYAQISWIRDYLHADLVSIVRAHWGSDACGVAYMPATSKAYGFSVTAADCNDAPEYALSHELGHNLSADHDPANQGESFRPYSHGYQVPGLARTVMSYAQPCNCVRYNLFSTPLLTFPGTSISMGTPAESDNVRSINEYAPYVANIYP
ncbi:hypothetical protein KCV01_g8959, partial [Aureobasidium melanogenum]